MRSADGQQALDPLATRLADAHQDPGGEGDAQPPGGVDHRQAPVGSLVGCAMVRHAGLTEARARALQHQAEADVHLPEPRHVRVGEESRVGVRQKAVGERHRAGPVEVLDGARLPQRSERAAVRGEGLLRLVPQAEQRLGTPELARANELLLDLRGRHRPLAGVARGASEGAVVAVVAAQVREGEKDLGRVRDHAPEERVAHRGGGGTELGGEPGLRVGHRERLVVRERRAQHRLQPIVEIDVGSIS